MDRNETLPTDRLSRGLGLGPATHDPTTAQVEILASNGAIRAATVVAVLAQLRQFRWGRILAAPVFGAFAAGAVEIAKRLLS